MNSAEKQIMQKIAATIRILSAEGVQKANSGHPGLPMGCAELGAYLYGKEMRHNPKNPNWMGRDRFVLSAGHGSMFLYSCLHLSGYDLPMEELKNFRQLHSMTPGHPEYGEAPGVETTTGPLGQGIGAATGMAIAQKMAAERFGKDLFDHKIFALAGDGCIMEGISSEAASLAGHLRLDNLVLIYDSNDICLDGPTAECLSEDTASRYAAYGWRVLTIDGADLDQIEEAFTQARKEDQRPTLIVAKTIIGRGAPNKQGKSAAHGAPIGPEEIELVKKAHDWPQEDFHVPQDVRDYFADRAKTFEQYEADWNAKVAKMKQSDPEKGKLWDICLTRKLPEDFADQVWAIEVTPDKATRAQGQEVNTGLGKILPYFVTGSADLSCSDLTAIKGEGIVSATNWMGRNLKFGVREFAMSAANYGMALYGMVQPLCGTFLTFSDYMRNAVRLASLMKQRVFYQFTHDSIFLGEDGPTHQPVEQIASLRAMPNLSVVRPCDGNELKAAWIKAFDFEGPAAFILSRQAIKGTAEVTADKAREGVAKGAYVLKGEPGAQCDVLMVATGSEVATALDAAKILEGQGKTVRVVSMPCWNWFEEQDDAYKQSVLGGEASLKVSIEAGASMGWHKWIGSDGLTIAVDTFGVSAPLKQIQEHFGFTPEQIAEKIQKSIPVSA